MTVLTIVFSWDIVRLVLDRVQVRMLKKLSLSSRL